MTVDEMQREIVSRYRNRSVADEIVRRFRNVALDPRAALGDMSEPVWAPNLFGSDPDTVRECVLPTLVDLWQRIAGTGARPSDRLRDYPAIYVLASSAMFWHLRSTGMGEKEAHAYVGDGEMMIPTWLTWWYAGCPILRLHESISSPMLLTDVSSSGDTRWPWPAFCIDLGEESPLRAVSAEGDPITPRYVWLTVMRLAKPVEGTGRMHVSLDRRTVLAALERPGRESMRACLPDADREIVKLVPNASQLHLVLLSGRIPNECRIWWDDIIEDGADFAGRWAPDPDRDERQTEPLHVGPNVYRERLVEPDYIALSAAKRLMINLALYFESIPKNDVVRVKHGSAIRLAGRREVPPADRWIVGRGREIDIRIVEAARASAQSTSGWHLSKRFVVRGHWRDQPCGPGRASVRPTWIRPYWKGPQDAEALVQAVTLKGASD